MGANVGIERVGMEQQMLDLLQRVDDFDEARVVVIEAGEYGAAIQVAELGPLLPGARRGDAVDDVHARQRTHAVHAIGIAEGLIEAGLEVSPGLSDLGEEIGESGVGVVGDYMAAGIEEAEFAGVM